MDLETYCIELIHRIKDKNLLEIVCKFLEKAVNSDKNK